MDRTPSASVVAQVRGGGSQRESYQQRQRGEENPEEDSELSLSTLLASEKEKRLRAESQVEALRQSCLEFSRLLELEKRKAKRSSTTQGPVDLSVGGGVRRESVSQGESEGERDGGGEEEERNTAEQKRKGSDALKNLPSPFEFIAPRQDDIGLLPPTFLFDNFSSTVFSQLPDDLQRMLRVDGSDDSDDGAPSPLTLAYRAVQTDSPKQLKELLTKLGEAVLETPEGEGLLEEACENGSDGCVRVLLVAGSNPGATSQDDGMAPLHIAARNGHANCISLLLKWGAHASLQDNDGQTPLFFALCEGHGECVDKLLEAGSSLQAITKMEYTVLHAAVSGNLPDILRHLLIQLRTSQDSQTISHIINYRDKDGNTALHLAASRGYKQCVEVLCGCPQLVLSLRDRWNRTALDISTDDCRDILLSKECKEVVVCVQAHLPNTDQATPVAIGRATILKHHKCLDAELLAAQALEQYCHNLKAHVPIPPGMESGQDKDPVPLTNGSLEATPSSQRYSGDGRDGGRKGGEGEGDGEVDKCENGDSGKEKPKPSSWAEILQKDIEEEETRERREDQKQERGRGRAHLDFLHTAYQGLAKMDLDSSSIATYRIGALNWSPGDLGKQQRSKSLFAMVGDRKGGGLSWITGGKPTEIHLILKGEKDGHLDQLAFELMIPKSTLHHYISMILRDKAVVFHGPQGCGKTFLAKSIAEFLKIKLGPQKTPILHVSLHPSFRRDDLFRMLHLNGLLIQASDRVEKGGETIPLNPQIVILDDLDRISGYSTPSILSELLTMLNYRGPLNPTWMDTVYSREGKLLYPAGTYYLKKEAYFIATRTQPSGEALPVAVMDHFSHIPLAREEEPCAGVLYRQLTARVIHSRHGDIPHRTDKVHKCVRWVWELWQLYNHYMKQLDLTELCIGLKHVLQCPVETVSTDGIQSWLCQFWQHHLTPRVEETLFHSRRMDGQHHQQTVSLLLKAVLVKAFKPTCPLQMEAASKLFQKLQPSSTSFSPAVSSSPKTRRQESENNSVLQSMPTTDTSSVHSSSSAPVVRNGSTEFSERDSTGKGPSHKAVGRLRGDRTDGAETASLDHVRPRSQSSARNAMRRLRSRTISLFGTSGMGVGPGGGEGSSGEGKERKGSRKDMGGSLPRIFKKVRSRPPLPVLAEKTATDSTQDASNARELEDFFDMLSLATSNRFDDQRSPAPPPLTKRTVSQPNSPSKTIPNFSISVSSPEENQELKKSPGTPPNPPEEASGFDLDAVPPPLAASMPDLLSEDSDTQQRSKSMTGLSNDDQRGLRTHSDPYSYVRPSQREKGIASSDVKYSEPPRRRVQKDAPNDDQKSSSTGVTPVISHRASPLATTTHVYARGSYQKRGGGEGGRRVSSASRGKEEGEDVFSDMRSGSFLPEVEVGDIGVPRTASDSRIKRPKSEAQTMRPRLSSDLSPNFHTFGGGGVREGWTDRQGRRGSPSPRGRRTSAPMPSISNGHRPRRILSEGDRSQSLEGISEAEGARNSLILIDAGLGFLSPDSPVVRGTLSGSNQRLNMGKTSDLAVGEQHEM